jgi:Na+-transporting methylmalonyl-CoA/oxaloacetate decarboxylase gamma subunit
MTFTQGIGLLVLGIVITFAFFVVWVKAMESESKNINRKDKDHE